MPNPRRMDFIYQKACEFIVEQKIRTLPVNPFKIIANNGWGLVTYRRLAELSGQACASIPELFRCNDGFTIFNSRNYCIAYNSDITPYNRILFTLMHEIGHIVLGHFRISSADNLKTGSDKTLEGEASFFAGNVMAPSVVIARCGLADVSSLRSSSGLSYEAAEKRLRQFGNWVPSPCDDAVRRLLDEYIKLNVNRRTGSGGLEITCEDGFL